MMIKEEDNTHDVPMQYVDDIEAMVISKAQYKQRGKGSNEIGTQPPMDSQKGSLPKHSLQATTLQQKIKIQRVIQVVVVVIKTFHKEKLKIPASSK